MLGSVVRVKRQFSAAMGYSPRLSSHSGAGGGARVVAHAGLVAAGISKPRGVHRQVPPVVAAG